MNKHKIKSNAYQLLKHPTGTCLILALCTQTLITGCASFDRKEESIETILQKENVLIEKVKAERASAEVQHGVSQSESLKKAESHLIMALDGISRANETMTKRIIDENREEALIDRLDRSGR